MNDWIEVKLGDLISIKGGYSYKGKHIGTGESILLGMGCVSNKEMFLLSGGRPYNGSCPSNHLAKPGDIVLATRQQSDNLPILGLPAIVPKEFQGQKVIVGTNLYKVDNDSEVSNQYIYWRLRCPDYYNHILASAKGSTVRMITKDAVESFNFLCPTIYERENIVEVLSSLDDKIHLLNSQNKTLEQMAETLFRQWFVEEDNINWKQGSLGDFIIHVKNSISAKKIANNIPYIGLEHISRRNIALVNYGDVKSVVSNKFQFDKGDILFGKLRPYFHKVCIAPFDGVCSTDILVLRPKSEELTSFALFALFQDEVIEYSNISSGGTRMPRTSWEVLKKYPIKIPSLSSIKIFEEQVSLYLQKIFSNINAIQKLEEMRDMLLPKLMNGTVRVVNN